MEWKDYAEFTAADFLADDFFMEWVLYPDAENQAFWQAWQQHYPEKQQIIAEARAMLLSLEYERHNMPVESYDRIWHRLHEKMDDVMPETMRYERTYYRRGWRRAAIVTGVLGVLALGAYWLRKPADKRALYTSQFGENRRLLLPDSSVVILGPHSTLRATAFQPAAKTREVWLDGEAYFIIRNDPATAKPFTVHTGDLNIEVLGTEFNVNNYNGRSQVVLHSGKVALQDKTRKASRIVMEPGELIEYRAENNRYIRRKVATEKYVSWVNNTLVFDNTSLKEVAVQLHNKYGIRVLFADSSLLQEQFSATLEQADHKVVLKAIEEAFGAQLQQKDDSTFLLGR
jgi:ferric-dicitrate binding protein FerR (iron transport regulator)